MFIPSEVKRIIIPVGSGMSLAGLLHGMLRYNVTAHVVGVCVGADPTKRLNTYAPNRILDGRSWKDMVTLVESPHKYSDHVDAKIGNIILDPVYEAKVLQFALPEDLFWIVGRRETA